MNNKLDKELRVFEQEVLNYIKAQAPYRTGQLKANIRKVKTNNGFKIVIDIWYMQYTEEAWTYNKRWGKTLLNPNYKWLRNSVERLCNKIANKLEGRVRREN